MRIMTALPPQFLRIPRLGKGQSARPLAVVTGLALVVVLLGAGYARGGGLSQRRSIGPASESMAVAEGPLPALDSAKGTGGTTSLSGVSAANQAAPRSAAPASGASGAAAPFSPQQTMPPLSASIVDRMIVKTGALTLRLSETASGDALSAAVQRVNGVVAGVPGAYVAASSTTYRVDMPGVPASAPREVTPSKPFPMPEPQPSTMATLTLKVPVDSFDQTMQRLRDLGSPLAENVSTQEVTEEYVDLEAQVRNLEATEQQYLRFLERAQRIEEILPIQQRLTEVRGQIERLRGRMTLLQRRADMSTITLSLTVPAGKGSPDPSGEPRALRTIKEAWAHLSVALSGALDLVIYLAVYALPVAPIVAAIMWWRRRQPGAPSPATAGGAV